MSDRLHTTLFGRSLDDYRREPIAPCEHGQPAKRVFVVDRETGRDVEGPVGMESLDTMASIRDDHAADHPGDVGRFTLAFVHVPRRDVPCCRTEQDYPTPDRA